MYQTDDAAQLIYQGNAVVDKYGRSIKQRQYFTLSSLDEDGFNDALDVLSGIGRGNHPVYLYLGHDDELLIQQQEFLLTRASTSKTQKPMFRLECDDDETLYDKTVEWSDYGVPMHATIVYGEFAKEGKPKTGKHSATAKRIRRSSWLNDIGFLRCVGSERKHMDFIKAQRCCISGEYEKDASTGAEWCDPAHIRQVQYGSGVAQKPPYIVVPLHPLLHAWSHQHSMTELWTKAHVQKGYPRNMHYRRLPRNAAYPVATASDAAHAFFFEKAEEYQRKWVEEEIINWAGIPRLSYLADEQLIKYLTEIGAAYTISDFT